MAALIKKNIYVHIYSSVIWYLEELSNSYMGETDIAKDLLDWWRYVYYFLGAGSFEFLKTLYYSVRIYSETSGEVFSFWSQ